MALIIDSDDKDMVLEQLRQHFGYDTVLSGMEYTSNMLIDYSNIFDLLEYAVGSAIIFILILMTYLYSSVFIAEESSEIALLKSIGFSEGSIKAAHLFRILILSLVSVILGEILLRTLGQLIIQSIMESLGITGFGLLPEFLMSFIAVPVIIIGAVLIAQWLCLKKVNRIDIKCIKDE